MKKIMEDFVTCGQMKILEQRADASGLSYYQMMENAGTQAAQTIMDRYSYRKAVKEDTLAEAAAAPFAAENVLNRENISKAGNMPETVEKPSESPNSDAKVVVFCGRGNNGGDGLVVARLMCQAGYDVTVVLVDGEPKTADSIANFDLLRSLPVRLVDMSDSDRVMIDLKYEPDIIVDAIYGTGFRGTLKNNGLKAAIYINNHYKGTDDVILYKPAMVIALDIPSGLQGDMTSEKDLDENSVTAHYTVTFHARKPVHLQPFAKRFCGEIIVADIGIDAEKLWEVE